MVLNVLGGNVDDHNKNFSFLMGDDGRWHVAPAYDYTFSVDPDAPYYVNRHSMTINNRTEGITAADLLEVARRYGIKAAEPFIEKTIGIVSRYPEYGREAGVGEEWIGTIERKSLHEWSACEPIKIEHGISCRGNEPTRFCGGWVCRCHSAPFLLRRVNWSGRSGNQ